MVAIQPFLEAMRQAGAACGSDKILTHRFDQVYGRALAAYSSVGPFAMLEIGFGGGQGITFWRTLFPEVFHYCLDCDHGDWSMERTSVLRGDQSKAEDLQQAMARIRHPISLIIDDGSHHPCHQLLSFSLLFQHLLQPGGIYIIEDVETSYWRRGSLYNYQFSYGLGHRNSTVEAFKVVADFVNRRFLDPADLNWLHCSLLDAGINPAAAKLVETVSFGRNAIVLSKPLDSPSDSDVPAYPHLHLSSREFRPADIGAATPTSEHENRPRSHPSGVDG